MTLVRYLLSLDTYRVTGNQPSACWLDEHCLARVTGTDDMVLDVANETCRDVEGDVVLLELRELSGSHELPAHDAIVCEELFAVRYARRDMDGTFLRFDQRPPLAARHDLVPHPEGGWYRRTWVSDHMVDTQRGQRDAASAIHYLLPDGQDSRWHVVASDEMWLWHGPGLLELWLEPAPEPRLLGGPEWQDTEQQIVVPAGTWQRAHARGDVLVSCVVCPGFDFADFELRDQ